MCIKCQRHLVKAYAKNKNSARMSDRVFHKVLKSIWWLLKELVLAVLIAAVEVVVVYLLAVLLLTLPITHPITHPDPPLMAVASATLPLLLLPPLFRVSFLFFLRPFNL